MLLNCTQIHADLGQIRDIHLHYSLTTSSTSTDSHKTLTQWHWQPWLDSVALGKLPHQRIVDCSSHTLWICAPVPENRYSCNNNLPLGIWQHIYHHMDWSSRTAAMLLVLSSQIALQNGSGCSVACNTPPASISMPSFYLVFRCKLKMIFFKTSFDKPGMMCYTDLCVDH